ncbi:hypothetical protein DPMN_117080 [Dreissena polymorpha]|uniref:Uncharacterized protein n=1 Tax=Dreissena polymorpha TaxID=45954 RepID=A0A9D4KQ41_DREPO|nr:hypothetical protein DPMN_117080 [Dreissena polymorpha]
MVEVYKYINKCVRKLMLFLNYFEFGARLLYIVLQTTLACAPNKPHNRQGSRDAVDAKGSLLPVKGSFLNPRLDPSSSFTLLWFFEFLYHYHSSNYNVEAVSGYCLPLP